MHEVEILGSLHFDQSERGLRRLKEIGRPLLTFSSSSFNTPSLVHQYPGSDARICVYYWITSLSNNEKPLLNTQHRGQRELSTMGERKQGCHPGP